MVVHACNSINEEAERQMGPRARWLVRLAYLASSRQLRDLVSKTKVDKI